MPENVTLSPKEAKVIRKTMLRLATYNYALVCEAAAAAADGMSGREFGSLWAKLFPASLLSQEPN